MRQALPLRQQKTLTTQAPHQYRRLQTLMGRQQDKQGRLQHQGRREQGHRELQQARQGQRAVGLQQEQGPAVVRARALLQELVLEQLVLELRVLA